MSEVEKLQQELLSICHGNGADTAPLKRILKQLEEADAVGYSRDGLGQYPLHIVAEKGNLAFAKILVVEDGADIDCKTPTGQTPLIWAVAGNHVAMVEFLVGMCANVNARNWSSDRQAPLHWAAKQCDGEMVKRLIALGADVDIGKDIGEYTPLHLACLTNNQASAKALLDAGADYTAKDASGKTPFDYNQEIESKFRAEIGQDIVSSMDTDNAPALPRRSSGMSL